MFKDAVRQEVESNEFDRITISVPPMFRTCTVRVLDAIVELGVITGPRKMIHYL